MLFINFVHFMFKHFIIEKYLYKFSYSNQAFTDGLLPSVQQSTSVHIWNGPSSEPVQEVVRWSLNFGPFFTWAPDLNVFFCPQISLSAKIALCCHPRLKRCDSWLYSRLVIKHVQVMPFNDVNICRCYHNDFKFSSS